MGRQAKNSKQFRRDVGKLKRAGLLSSRVDPATQRDTAYMRAQLRKYRDVLDGTAKTIRFNTTSYAKGVAGEYKQLDRKGKTVVVPVTQDAKSVSFNKKSRQVEIIEQRGGRTRKTILRPSKKEAKHKKGKVALYGLSFMRAGRGVWFDSMKQLRAYMKQYTDTDPGRWNINRWQDFVEIRYVDSNE